MDMEWVNSIYKRTCTHEDYTPAPHREYSLEDYRVVVGAYTVDVTVAVYEGEGYDDTRPRIIDKALYQIMAYPLLGEVDTINYQGEELTEDDVESITHIR